MNVKLKYHIYISIQTPYSLLCWRNCGSDYCLVSSWVWSYKLGTPVFGEFLPFSADPLKICQVGWGVLLHSYFRSLHKCFKFKFKSGLWLSHSRTFRVLFRSHSCVVLAVCLDLLSCWKVLSALEQIFIKDLSVLCSVNLSLDPD
jgi:hypothetical protein